MTWHAWLFVLVWAATVPLRLTVVANLARHRLLHIYPMFSAWLVIGAGQTAYRIHAGLTGGARAYETAWSWGQWLTMAMLLAVVIECFVLHARHFEGFAGYGARVGAIVLAIAAAVAALVWIDTPENPLVAARVHSALLGYVSVALTAVVFSVFGRNYFRVNLRRHRALLQWYFFVAAVGHYVQASARRGQWYDVAAAWITTGGAAVVYVAWLRQNATDERWTPPPPPPLSEAQMIRIQASIGRAAGAP